MAIFPRSLHSDRARWRLTLHRQLSLEGRQEIPSPCRVSALWARLLFHRSGNSRSVADHISCDSGQDGFTLSCHCTARRELGEQCRHERRHRHIRHVALPVSLMASRQRIKEKWWALMEAGMSSSIPIRKGRCILRNILRRAQRTSTVTSRRLRLALDEAAEYRPLLRSQTLDPSATLELGK